VREKYFREKKVFSVGKSRRKKKFFLEKKVFFREKK